MGNKALWIIIPIMVTLMWVDFGSTLLNKSLLPALETNPLYPIVGLIPLILLNKVSIAGVWWLYRKTKPFWRYLIITFVTWHSIIRIYAIKSNITNYLNPPSPEVVASITPAMRQSHYLSLILTMLMPIIICIIIYILLRIDHNVMDKKNISNSIDNGLGNS